MKVMPADTRNSQDAYVMPSIRMIGRMFMIMPNAERPPSQRTRWRVRVRLTHDGGADSVAPFPRSWGGERGGGRGKTRRGGLRPSPQPSPREERGEGADRVCRAAAHASPNVLSRYL